ncbi:nicotinate-nucleotide adenylyltransferase [Salegentibacter sediminis]|uniref:nicotinate-nucleotide adenylyltransferase n=1 Tax=Salegentibacter sediminis TaxID=1930251 RepID=UPI0009BEA9FA|nr:nicotinate-nucleotide adenylyltransferase [Salegentibacter sediminis]
MKKLLIALFVFGFTFQSFAQITELPEIELVAVNYKYLDAAGNEDASISVKQLQQQVAEYDVRKADFYADEYDFYTVNFFIPDGKILASYDEDGNLLRTAEKFKDVALPQAVREAIAQRFPNWNMAGDVYLVNYHDAGKVTKKYKILLENGDKRMRVKTDEKGNFL